MNKAPPVKLTRREHQIALLVSEGLTSREIAQRLFISERTAEGHVEQIRNKLGFKSRSQVAAWVSAEGSRTVEPVSEAPVPAQQPTASVPKAATRWLWASGGAMAALALGAAAIVFLIPALTAAAPGPRITTFAGTGVASYSADENSARSTDLEHPAGVAVGPTGELYIAEGYRIRRVGSDGRVETLAGDSLQGFGGDGASAKAARLALTDVGTGLVGLALDGNGNLYVADTNNDRVRKVTPEGLISTVVGAGTPGHCFRNAPPADVGDGGLGIDAVLCQPHGLVVDNQGNLFIADTGDNRVRELGSNGIIHTVAGTGQPGFTPDGALASAAELSAPEGVAIDKVGDLYIADSGNDLVREVRDRVITTVAGSGSAGFTGDGGRATKAELNVPLGVAVDDLGNLYIADSANDCVRKVDLSDTITTFAGNGQAGYFGDTGFASRAELTEPVALAIVGSGKLYIADMGNNRVRLVRLTSS